MDEEQLQDTLSAEDEAEEEIDEEAEEEYVDGEEEETEEVEEDAPVPASARPAPSTIHVQTGLTPAEREIAEEHFTPVQLDLIEGMMARVASASQSSMLAATASVDAALDGASSSYRAMIAPRLNVALANMTPQQRAAPRSGELALISAIAMEAEETGENVMDVMARHTQMRASTAPVQRARPVVAAKPAAARTPSPSNAGRGPVVRSSNTNASSDIKLVASAMGISVAEAQRMGLK